MSLCGNLALPWEQKQWFLIGLSDCPLKLKPPHRVFSWELHNHDKTKSLFIQQIFIEHLVGVFPSWKLILGASLVAQMVKNLPVMQETRVQSLGWDDPLEEEMTTHSSTLSWRIPWTEEPGGLQSMGHKELDTTKWIIHTVDVKNYFIFFSSIILNAL